jgi:hypothetical protein
MELYTFYPFQLLKNPADWWLLAVFHFEYFHTRLS